MDYPDDFQAKTMDDLVGARVIGYSKYDVVNLVELIKKNLKVHKIEDKQVGLGKTGTGYQSIHITASLSADTPYMDTKEYEKIQGYTFSNPSKNSASGGCASI